MGNTEIKTEQRPGLDPGPRAKHSDIDMQPWAPDQVRGVISSMRNVQRSAW